MVARNPDYALYKSLADVYRIAENNDIASFERIVRQDMAGNRTGRRVGKLIHQKMIADQKRIFHGAGRNDVSLNEIGGPEQQQNDGNRPFRQKPTLRLRREFFGRGRTLALNSG